MNISDAQNFNCASTAGNLDTQSTDAQDIQPCPSDPTLKPCCITSVESPKVTTPVTLPREYEEYQEIFSKERATHLPPHRPWDCAIDLLPNHATQVPGLSPLSTSRAMEEYIEEALSAEYNRPSTSPTVADFFFVGKKDGGLRPCIKHRGLNALMVQYPYPLLLVPVALEQLRGAKFFTKMDLRSAYNLIRIKEGDKWKTAFHTVSGHYEYLVMPYGLMNAPAVFQSLIKEVFKDLLNHYVIAYIDDILIYSDLVEAHINHIRTVLQCLLQNHLYVKLEKSKFHHGPILQHPDPGVGAVLSQWHGNPGKLHPCAYYSRKLTAAEVNYDVGNQELLSMKAALGEWRHWLEGARHPFLILTDHCNLEYLCGAKRLNPRQARWALFFFHFQFSVTYRPGSKNGKADALSRQLVTKDRVTPPEPIILPSIILAPIQWNLVEEIHQAHTEDLPPAICPASKLYVLIMLHQRVMQWTHESLSSGHPGVHCTGQLLRP
ncbi:hypothetical protein QTP86_017324 [Hemibagrus guttatus]|nr:hypothetical protein QTP86_017324 [Hemibagrus guttatus]